MLRIESRDAPHYSMAIALPLEQLLSGPECPGSILYVTWVALLSDYCCPIILLFPYPIILWAPLEF